MIERYVFLKLSSDVGEAERQELIGRAQRMFPTMDGVETFALAQSTNVSGPCKWDIAMRVGFESPEAAERYMGCPIHADFDAELAMSLEDIESWSFELAS